MSKLKLSPYEHQIELPEIGIEGQKKIFASKVLIVGAGGLGCPAALYLAGSGLGTIGIIDGDTVDKTNLHRQILYTEQDIGLKKADIAFKKLKEIAPNQEIRSYSEFMTDLNARSIIEDYDIVLDATDNHIVRLLINEICLEKNKPWVYGALYRYEGQIAVFGHRSYPCFSCLFPDVTKESALPTCKTSGIVSPVSGIVGCMQAMEVLKIILDLNKSPFKLNIYDFLTNDLKKFSLERNLQCRVCSQYRS